MSTFQTTGRHGSRKPSASTASSITPHPSSAANAANAANALQLRGRTKAPLGPRERPHDFSKQR